MVELPATTGRCPYKARSNDREFPYCCASCLVSACDHSLHTEIRRTIAAPDFNQVLPIRPLFRHPFADCNGCDEIEPTEARSSAALDNEKEKGGTKGSRKNGQPLWKNLCRFPSSNMSHSVLFQLQAFLLPPACLRHR